MSSFENIGSVECGNIEDISVVFKEKLDSFNKFFNSKLAPESGIYGVTEILKDNGVVEKLGKNELGHAFKEYYNSDGQLYRRRESLGNHSFETTYYDDNGLGYLKKITKFDKNLAKVSDVRIKPNSTIIKDNFTAVTDEFGRPISNKMKDIQLKSGERESLSNIKRNDSYRKNDQRGHLIPDSFGGPASQENIIPQLDKVNDGKIKQIEGIARDLKKQGKTVDYEVKTNYSGSKTRPTSFEVEITADGKKVELAPELKKIYNEAPEDLTLGKKIAINAGEKFGLANELGIKNGLVAGEITMAVSSCENISAYVDGEISAEEMITDIVEDTAVAGAMGYGTTFVSTAVSQAMSKSSSALINKVGGSCAPAAVVAFGVESYEDISAFVKGEIDGDELAYNLGENAAGVAGGFVGGALAGAALGSVAGPAGTVVGGVVGGVVGTVVATESYHVAVEFCAEEAEVLADKAKELSLEVVGKVAVAAPEALEDVKEAFADFSASVKLPFKLGQ